MKKLLPIIAITSFAGSALAGTPVYTEAPAPVAPVSEINYNTFGVGYLHTWFEDIEGVDSADGVELSFSVQLVEYLYFAAGGSWQDVSTDNGSTDFWTASAGLGGYLPITSNMHLVAEGGALFYGFDNGFDGIDNNDAAAYAKPHLRARYGAFEIHTGAIWSNVDVTNEWAGFVDTFYEFSEGWDFAIGAAAGDKAITANAGIRYRF